MTLMRTTWSPDTPTAARIRFASWFVLSAFVLFSLYTFPYEENGISERWFDAYLRAYARLAGAVLGVVEPGVHVAGASIVGRYGLSIVKSCDAMEAIILFSAAVLAFPVGWRRRTVGILLGVPTLIAINIVRICSLYYVGVYRPEAFELVHIEIWPLILVLASVAVFFIWASWANPSPRGDSHAAA